MNGLDQPLSLNPRVTVEPVADYPLSVQERLSGALDDYIVSERRSRFSAIRVSAATAEFLKLFGEPKLVGEAVLELSSQLEIEPQALLQEAFPTLLEMRRAGVLMTPPEADVSTDVLGEPRLRPGQAVGGWKVVRMMGTTTETEIYEVRSAAGVRAALKLVPAEAPEFVLRAAERERLALPWLAEQDIAEAPDLLDVVEDDGELGLLISWRNGRSLNQLADDPTLTLEVRLRLARGIAEAYARLHAVGALHGDVHGGNLLATADGGVSLVDFGMAILAGVQLPELPRIGLVESYEPEAAQAVIDRGEPLDPTPAGEQYGVANLITLAITGRPPMILPLEQREALRQIVSQPPRAWDLTAPASLRGLEAKVARALAKRPEERFASFGAFAEAVIGEIDRVRSDLAAEISSPAAPTVLRQAPRSSVQALRTTWGLGSRLIETGLAHEPCASIYYGGAGVALGLARAAVVAEDGELLAAAQIWNDEAMAAASSGAAGAFEGVALGVSSDRFGPLSMLNGALGLPYVAARIAAAGGDHGVVAAMAERVARHVAAALDCDGDDPFALDLGGGAPGALLACAQLQALLQDPDGASATALAIGAARLREHVLQAIAGACDRPDLGGVYLGLAHGLAGALFAVIEADRRQGTDIDARCRRGLEALEGLAFEDRGGVRWPVRLTDGASIGWPGWCHGAAGHIQLWLAVAGATGEPRFLAFAQGAAEFGWKARDEAGASLCCGVSGLALAYERLASAVDDPRWRRRGEALVFGERIDQRDFCAPGSLFRGELGLELARLELGAAAGGAFPLLHSPMELRG